MFQIQDPRSLASWNTSVQHFSDYSVFHSRQWTDVLCGSYGYKPCYFTLEDSKGYKVVIPMLQIDSVFTGKRGVSLPFTDFCEPLFAGEFSPAWLEVLRAHGKAAGWKYYELRGADLQNHPATPSLVYLAHILDLNSNLDQIFQKFRTTTKRNIQKARWKKVKVNFLQTLDGMAEFYRLNVLTRRRHGLPPQPWRFFEKLYQEIILNNLGYIALATFQKKTVAGVIALHSGRKAVFKYGASDHFYRNTNANYQLIWEIIQKCVREGYTSLHFGRTHPAAPGLIQYKRGWGSREYPLKYYRYSFRKNEFVSSRSAEIGLHTRIFQNLNTGTLKWIGKFLYRHLG